MLDTIIKMDVSSISCILFNVILSEVRLARFFMGLIWTNLTWKFDWNNCFVYKTDIIAFPLSFSFALYLISFSLRRSFSSHSSLTVKIEWSIIYLKGWQELTLQRMRSCLIRLISLIIFYLYIILIKHYTVKIFHHISTYDTVGLRNNRFIHEYL